MAVSLRVPVDVAQRIAKLVAAKDTSAHAFMLAAIREKLDAEEAQGALLAEAQRRLADMKVSGRGIPAEEVFEFLRARARGAKAKRPRARKTS